MKHKPLPEPILLNDRDVAHMFSMSESWVRNQRFRQAHGLEYEFDVMPIHINTAVRYRRDDVLAWIERRTNRSKEPVKREEPAPSIAKSAEENPPFDDDQPQAKRKADVCRPRLRPSARRAISKSVIGCRHISGDPKDDPTNCGRPVQQDSSYCKEHHALCYNKAPKHWGKDEAKAVSKKKWNSNRG